jgi:hypothetical protein
VIICTVQEDTVDLRHRDAGQLKALATRVAKAAGRSAMQVAATTVSKSEIQQSMFKRCGLLARYDECTYR